MSTKSRTVGSDVNAACTECGLTFKGRMAGFEANDHTEDTGHPHDLIATIVTRVEKVRAEVTVDG